MVSAGFRDVEIDPTLFQIRGRYRKAKTIGRLNVTLLPANGSTEVVMRATANVDNLFALFRSPTDRIIREFTRQL